MAQNTFSAETILKRISLYECEAILNWRSEKLGELSRGAHLAIYMYGLKKIDLVSEMKLMITFLKEKDRFYAEYLNKKHARSELVDKIVLLREVLLNEISFAEWATAPVGKMTDDQLIFTVYKISGDFEPVPKKKRKLFILVARELLIN
ncbi:MAG: hypothetical protein Hyperionvirus14_10 [Hyperionvirus sp.]|uniref:Uncharacterized protein n=1 Tax=Hyperionvirus sp. TaxID=2487770 RepID=A0A3G5ACC8_9VIRU|nr:MAG: hypothetical protein Hyperionvirus14_10 [Hyperionvirus sp.]